VILQVSDASDPAVSPYRHVGDPDWLVANGLFVAEGRLVVDRLISAGRHRIESLLVTPAAFKALDQHLTVLDAPVMIALPALLNEITGFNFHRGCLALAARDAPRALNDVITGGVLLGLESVGNPDNVGGLFRTAAAFGVTAMLVDNRTADPFYRKAIRTSMGAVLDMPVAGVDDWPAAFGTLRAAGYRIVALTPAGTAEPLSAFVQHTALDRLLVVVGAEGAGLSSRVLEAADHRVAIPITSAVDSLNVTVAAGIALARIAEARQRL
jgi:tRNA G18 (ribose-2'-O)-methylase SpoU